MKGTDIQAQLSSLFQQFTGLLPEQITPLTAAGSNRQYFRLLGNNHSLIGVAGTSQEENTAFLSMARHFHKQQLNTPEVYAVSNDRMVYLQQDLGSLSLFDYITDGRTTGNFSEAEITMLRRTVKALARFQVKAAENFDFSCCYPQPCFNKRSILWDLNYFKYCFLKATGIEFQEDRLEDDFETLAAVLLQAPSDYFLYRDFQSRNVMLLNDEPFFIDFQGGRRGPCYYDVASFLWQAKANIPATLRMQLFNDYLDTLSQYVNVNREEACSYLPYFVLFRTMQVLGAYGFRGYFERKPHFLQSVPYAILNLKELLTLHSSLFTTLLPCLTQVLTQLTETNLSKPSPNSPNNPEATTIEPGNTLTVTIYSFSYKKGIPTDPSGNGGGFVFDCRAIHNPGKYEQYQSLTGNDQPVIDFLEKDGEILTFLQNVYSLVDASVARYLKRGFTSLMVSFGCTGGQHRSLYAAEKTAAHLYEKFGIKVHLIHREQNIERIFNPQ